MKIISFTIPGPPFPKEKTKLSSKGQLYIPRMTQAAEKRIKEGYLALGLAPLNSDIELHISCVFEPPASWSPTKKEAALSGVIRKNSKPEVSRLLETVCDALTGVAWEDSSQIMGIHITKKYGIESRLEVFILVLDSLM